MTSVAVKPLASIRSIALVWAHRHSDWTTVDDARRLFNRAGIDVQLVWPEQLFDIEHGTLEIDAIASIGGALDAGRRAAVRRRIPHVVLDRGLDRRGEFDRLMPVCSPVLRVHTCMTGLSIALRSVELRAIAPDHSRSAPPTTPVTPTSSFPPTGHRMTYTERSLLLIDRYAVRIRDHTLITVQRDNAGLVEYRDTSGASSS